MKVVDINGKTVSWNLGGYNNNRRQCSELHIQVRQLLRKLFPTESILEEVQLPNLVLYLDFFLPLRKLAIECQGIQHTQFVPFFHKTQLGFLTNQKNDKIKLEWCELNSINLVHLYHDEDEEIWTQKLTT